MLHPKTIYEAVSIPVLLIVFATFSIFLVEIPDRLQGVITDFLSYQASLARISAQTGADLSQSVEWTSMLLDRVKSSAEVARLFLVGYTSAVFLCAGFYLALGSASLYKRIGVVSIVLLIVFSGYVHGIR